ncbi:MAG: IS66 family insertion sequence element accessory protein TnpB [Betaproteobacteria bacterium]|nr:IS66 family insertion sequence element accessory protein TnpB [Betaproteobacteria bacterium]
MTTADRSRKDSYPEQSSILNEISADHIMIACGYTDMRRSIDGLASLVQQAFKLEPCSRNLFLFCGRRSDRIKGLLWEGDGFLLLYKRLECGRFQWPRRESEARQITERQLRWLLEGLSIDQPKALTAMAPKRVV